VRLPFRKQPSRLSADRLTVAVGGAALVTAGTVVGGELLRLTRRRVREAVEEADSSAGARETAGHAILATGLATQDTLAVARGGYVATPRSETVLFNMLSGFVAAFALVRLSTYGIRVGWWPGNVNVRGRHIHHFVPGILIAFGTGAAALLSEDESVEPLLAIPFGAGIGLTFDEAALLLDLRDVYWTREGVVSVQLSLGLSAVLGATILGMRILRRGERASEEEGTIPPPPPGGAGIWPVLDPS
jgi:hypothetical protein